MATPSRSMQVLRHVHFEDLGLFTAPVQAAGFDLKLIDPLTGALPAPAGDALVVLGGPISATEDDRYPFLRDELKFIERWMTRGRPVFGVCLGAQLIARVAGARVYPAAGPEIGYAPVELTAAGRESLLAPLATAPLVLHWHGETFDLPAGAEQLARTELCENQAFRLGEQIVGVQFHPEADPDRIEHWLVGHAAELNGHGVDPVRLRAEARANRESLRLTVRAMAELWLADLERVLAA
ncbi:MAG: glutamine amidotransferase [Pseudomonadota bacterium]